MTIKIGDSVTSTRETYQDLHAARGPFVVTDVRFVRKGFDKEAMTQVRAEDPQNPKIFIVDGIDHFIKED